MEYKVKQTFKGIDQLTSSDTKLKHLGSLYKLHGDLCSKSNKGNCQTSTDKKSMFETLGIRHEKGVTWNKIDSSLKS